MPNLPFSVSVLLFEHFSTYCLANAVEPLRAANTLARAPLYNWRYVGLDTLALTSSSGLPVSPEARLSEQSGDLLLILPSYGFADLATPACLRALRAARTRFATLAGLDTGSWLMARAGLLDGQRATIHWDELDGFAEAFPDVTVSEDRTVMDGSLWSCGGGATTLELMLALITRHHGAMLGLEVAALFMQGERPERPWRGNGGRVETAVALMRRNIEQPLPIGSLARQIGLSQRSLEASFARHLGRSPHGIYRALRLEAARRLVEQTTLSVAEIATRTGYENPSALTRAFRTAHGTSPRGLRARLTESGAASDPIETR